jgi:hypothetical protein
VRFEDSELARLGETQEIEIETRSPSGAVHQATVWPLVRDGVVYLRSYKGPAGRWYRDILDDPSITLSGDGFRIEGRAAVADDPESIDACSEALREKYPESHSLAAMLVDDVLPTTVRIEPAASPAAVSEPA